MSDRIESQRIIGIIQVKTGNAVKRPVLIDVNIDARNKQSAIDLFLKAPDIFLDLGDGRHIVEIETLS